MLATQLHDKPSEWITSLDRCCPLIRRQPVNSERPHSLDMTPPVNPAHSIRVSRLTAASPIALAAVALSHPPKGSEQQDLDIAAPSVEPGAIQVLSTASTQATTPTLAPIPSSLPR